jgi:hypothetical protein
MSEIIPDVDGRIAAFRKDLELHEPPKLVQRWITHGNAAALDEERYFELKETIATKFDIHPIEVVVVGSAKLGFSIVPKKRYRAFNDNSDIDVAIVSGKLFDAFWIMVYEYWRRLPDPYWAGGGEFQKYLFRGWIRPDKLPKSPAFPERDSWWEFFRVLARSRRFGKYGIAAGLYKSWHFLETYQEICVARCKQGQAL